MPGIVIVGAGFGGIGMGIALKKAGYHDFVILDKAPDLGGTWRDNRYPGCACDVPSPLYSYSFELNPDWSHLFAPQREIWDYLRRCARKYRLDEHIRYGTTVERMDRDDNTRRWNVETVRDGELHSYRPHAVGSAAAAPPLPPAPPGDRGVGPPLVPRRAGGPPLGPGGRAGRGDGAGRAGDPVRPAGGQTALPPHRLPAHAAVDPSAPRRGDTGANAGRVP